ncbi:MAG TPA: tetratricopeptide repeat protein [Alphaproteobacteria bacterium]|nr:tetratricopeptide repeat protein [Alphaproteobacteria bacterium]
MTNYAQTLVAAFDNHRAGRFAEAERLCRQTLALDPHQPDALHLLAILAYKAGRPADAVELARKAIARDGRRAEYHNTLGEALHTLGKNERAIESLRRAIMLDPTYAPAHYNFGNILLARRQYANAEASFRRAIALQPSFGLAHNNLGLVFKAQGEWGKAIECFRAAIEAEAGLAIAHYNVGVMLDAKDRFGEAILCYRKAIALQPAVADFHNNLGNDLMIQGALDDAVASLRTALTIDPKDAAVHSNLLMASCYREVDPETLIAEHKAWTAAHGSVRGRIERRFARAREPDRRLRIGYLSPDFRGHSVYFFLEPLLAAHDREKVEVFCYSNVKWPDRFTARLESIVDHWRAIDRMDDAAAAEKIESDRIDILVDLAGHTARNRLPLMAHKPAPVQMSWLGYPATTGLEAIDYRITDAVADPPGETERFHSETLLRLPRCFLCYSPSPDSPAVTSPPSFQARHITFGSFNNLTKVTKEVTELWSAILANVPGSRLLLKAKQTGDPATAARYLALFAANGIDAGRIEMASWSPSSEDHLSHYRRVDIALDPFPYNGTTTTCEALWMGVPTVVLEGRLHAGRVGVSLLSALGLDELIADARERYAAIAIGLAEDSQRLRDLRESLRARMAASPLCDAADFARAMENAYRDAWQRWCES